MSVVFISFVNDVQSEERRSDRPQRRLNKDDHEFHRLSSCLDDGLLERERVKLAAPVLSRGHRPFAWESARLCACVLETWNRLQQRFLIHRALYFRSKMPYDL